MTRNYDHIWAFCESVRIRQRREARERRVSTRGTYNERAEFTEVKD